MAHESALSAEDLRARLFHSLKDKGLLDSLKSQLRNRLVTELKTIGVGQTFRQEVDYAGEGSLLHRASNSLVADHLRRCNYDYSLSVFLPECGSAQDKIFTTRDLLQLLGISPQSSLYHMLAKQSPKFKDNKGFLWELLSAIAAQHGNAQRDLGVQTDDMRLPAISSLNEQFKAVDEYYSNIGDDHKSRGLAVEERILAYQRQLEERSRTDMQLEMARFKENELGRMRAEEREKCRKELEKSRKEMEATYKVKSEALLGRERNAIERLQTQQSIAEKETFTSRQSILEEIEAVRQREAELRRTQEIMAREKQLLEDRVKLREESAKKREEAARKSELEHEQRLHDQVATFKLEEQSRYMQRFKDLEWKEMRVKEDERKVAEDMSHIKLLKDELSDKRIRVNELEAQVQHAKHDLIGSQKQAEVYSEKLRGMVDYQMMKDDYNVLRKECEDTKHRLAETQRDLILERRKHEDVLREMGDRASHPTPDMLILQRELDKARSALRHDTALLTHQMQQSQMRLQEEAERNRELLRKYEEQTLQMKEMNREINDLRQQLHQHRTALNNEVYRRPKSGIANRSLSPSLCDLGDDPYVDHVPGSTHIDTGHYSAPDPELVALHNNDDNDGISYSEDQSYSFDIVHDTKKRLRNLEREADNLEQNYRDFHHKMTSVHTALVEEPTSTNKPRHHTNINNNGRDAYSPTLRSRLESRPQMDISVSTVRSISPPTAGGSARRTALTKNRPMTMDDLEARPGSPSVVVLEGSNDGGHDASAVTKDVSRVEFRVSPPGQERSEAGPSTVGTSLDDAWRRPAFKPVALDTAWKQMAVDEAEKKRKEEEDRKREDEEFAERRRQREEEKQRRWEEEQRELERIQQQQGPTSTEAEPTPEPENPPEPEIDPVMQKYMEMVAQQKEKEKQNGPEVAKKAIDTWNRGRRERTPSHSEQEISVADKSDVGGADSADDFDW